MYHTQYTYDRDADPLLGVKHEAFMKNCEFTFYRYLRNILVACGRNSPQMVNRNVAFVFTKQDVQDCVCLKMREIE